MSDILNIDALV